MEHLRFRGKIDAGTMSRVEQRQRSLGPAIRLRQPRLASPRSSWQRWPPAHTTAAGLHAHMYRSQRSLRRRQYHLPASLAPPSPLHPIPQSPRAVCSRRPPAPSPAIAAPWNPLAATTPPVGSGSAVESAAAVSGITVGRRRRSAGGGGGEEGGTGGS